MAEQSGFFPDVNGDREYTADFLADWVKSFIANGVYNGELAVTAADGMAVTIPVGRAWINGYYYHNDSDLTLAVTNADGVLSRIDTVVLRWNINARSITAQILQGDFASEPVVPEIVRTEELYDLKLAEIMIPAGTAKITQSLITDCRPYNDVCGIVHAVIDQIDTSALMKQLDDWASEYKDSKSAEFTEWFDAIKGKLSTDIAGSLQNQIDNITNGNTAVEQAKYANGIVGEIKFSPTGKALEGTFLCDGSTFNKDAYPKLYAFLGTDTLPDMRGCVVGMYGGDLGTGIGKVGSATHTHGTSGMSANISLSGTEIAAQQSGPSFNYNVYASLSCYAKTGTKPNSVKVQGDIDAASSIQPTYVAAFCIVHDFKSSVEIGNQVITNGNFATDTNSDGLADNFYLVDANKVACGSNIQTFIPTAQYGRLVSNIAPTAGHRYFVIASVQTSDSVVYLRCLYKDSTYKYVQFKTSADDFATAYFIVDIAADFTTGNFNIQSNTSSNWSNISVKNFMAIDMGVNSSNALYSKSETEMLNYISSTGYWEGKRYF